MATLLVTTSSNEARLLDADAARDVLERYYWDGECQADIRDDEEDGQSYLSVSGDDWSMVWRMPDDTDPCDFVPDWDQDSDEEFEQFLKEIAPFLAEPLTIQAIGAEACQFPLAASEWQVQPYSGGIRRSGFRCKPHVLLPS